MNAALVQFEQGCKLINDYREVSRQREIRS